MRGKRSNVVQCGVECGSKQGVRDYIESGEEGTSKDWNWSEAGKSRARSAGNGWVVEVDGGKLSV